MNKLSIAASVGARGHYTIAGLTLLKRWDFVKKIVNGELRSLMEDLDRHVTSRPDKDLYLVYNDGLRYIVGLDAQFDRLSDRVDGMQSRLDYHRCLFEDDTSNDGDSDYGPPEESSKSILERLIQAERDGIGGGKSSAESDKRIETLERRLRGVVNTLDMLSAEQNESIVKLDAANNASEASECRIGPLEGRIMALECDMRKERDDQKRVINPDALGLQEDRARLGHLQEIIQEVKVGLSKANIERRSEMISLEKRHKDDMASLQMKFCELEEKQETLSRMSNSYSHHLLSIGSATHVNNRFIVLEQEVRSLSSHNQKFKNTVTDLEEWLRETASPVADKGTEPAADVVRNAVILKNMKQQIADLTKHVDRSQERSTKMMADMRGEMTRTTQMPTHDILHRLSKLEETSSNDAKGQSSSEDNAVIEKVSEVGQASTGVGYDKQTSHIHASIEKRIDQLEKGMKMVESTKMTRPMQRIEELEKGMKSLGIPNLDKRVGEIERRVMIAEEAVEAKPNQNAINEKAAMDQKKSRDDNAALDARLALVEALIANVQKSASTLSIESEAPEKGLQEQEPFKEEIKLAVKKELLEDSETSMKLILSHWMASIDNYTADDIKAMCDQAGHGLLAEEQQLQSVRGESISSISAQHQASLRDITQHTDSSIGHIKETLEMQIEKSKVMLEQTVESKIDQLDKMMLDFESRHKGWIEVCKHSEESPVIFSGDKDDESNPIRQSRQISDLFPLLEKILANQETLTSKLITSPVTLISPIGSSQSVLKSDDSESKTAGPVSTIDESGLNIEPKRQLVQPDETRSIREIESIPSKLPEIIANANGRPPFWEGIGLADDQILSEMNDREETKIRGKFRNSSDGWGEEDGNENGTKGNKDGGRQNGSKSKRGGGNKNENGKGWKNDRGWDQWRADGGW